MLPEELKGRVGKQPDGSAKTREAKRGCIFTKTTTDQDGLPLRDDQSTSYVAGFESAADFMARVRQEAIRRRMAAACLVVLLVVVPLGSGNRGRSASRGPSRFWICITPWSISPC